MSEHTQIEWTDHTFNIAWGCEKVSPGCAHCYADTLSHRRGHDVWGANKPRRTLSENYWKQPLLWNRKAEEAGVRRRVFCSSMCDVFEAHPTIDAEREKLWPLIRATPNLDWQLLTKRAERIQSQLPPDWGPHGYENVWLGVSIENQRFAYRAAILSALPAQIRFVSAEPLLGPLTLEEEYYVQPRWVRGLDEVDSIKLPIAWIDWLIVGGESGPNARPMREEWVRSLRAECDEHFVAFFLKQLGGHPNKRGHERALLDGKRYVEMPAKAA